MLDPQPGERVLDACAAPGGKALYAAAKMQGQVLPHHPAFMLLLIKLLSNASTNLWPQQCLMLGGALFQLPPLGHTTRSSSGCVRRAAAIAVWPEKAYVPPAIFSKDALQLAQLCWQLRSAQCCLYVLCCAEPVRGHVTQPDLLESQSQIILAKLHRNKSLCACRMQASERRAAD